MDKARLVADFEEAMVEVYRRALSEVQYKASRFLTMIHDEGGLATAKYLLHAPQVSEGYTALWQRQRLDLTVEAVILNNARWHPLFTSDELDLCRERLRDYGYPVSE
jgi:hypothetical protein